MDESNKKENLLILGITSALVLFGIILRISGLQSRNLEYDEIWTFANYVKLPLGEMFTELATPNNHPLNSLFIKWFSMSELPQLLQIRLPVLLAGILLLACVGIGLRRLTNSIPGACFGLLLLTLNIPLIHYSQTARGYEFQALFTAGVMFSLLFFELDLKSPFRRILWAGMFLISGIATCLSVTSGVIFVTALAFSFVALFTDWRKCADLKKWLEKKELWIAFLLFAGFVLLWYGLNYTKLAKGQDFGNTVTSPGKFFSFVWYTVKQLPLTFTILISLVIVFLSKDVLQRRIALMGLLSAALVFLSALIFKAGDFRVYIPLIPILAISSALLFECLNVPGRRRLILPLFCILTVGIGLQLKIRLSTMNPPDIGRVFVTATQSVPPEALTIYSPTDSYVVATLFTNAFQADQLQRLKASRPISLLLMGTNTIGIYQEWTGNTVTYPVSLAPVSRGDLAGETTYSEFLLRPLQSGDSLKDQFLVVLIDEPGKEQFLRYFNFFERRFQTANIFCFLSMGAGRTVETTFSRTRILIYHSPEQSVQQMLTLQGEKGSAIRFFVMKGKES